MKKGGWRGQGNRRGRGREQRQGRKEHVRISDYLPTQLHINTLLGIQALHTLKHSQQSQNSCFCNKKRQNCMSALCSIHTVYCVCKNVSTHHFFCYRNNRFLIIFNVNMISQNNDFHVTSSIHGNRVPSPSNCSSVSRDKERVFLWLLVLIVHQADS